VKLRWSRRAVTRLEEIHAYIAQDNPTAALRTTQQIVQRIGQIVTFPNSGRRVPGYTRDDVRELIEGNYRIIYRLGTDRIEVLTVKHCAQRLTTDLRKP
jgi:plasmid stabilization system protein ParE